MTRRSSDEEAPAIPPERIWSAPQEHGDDPDRLAAIVEEALAHPEAEELYFVDELLIDLAEAYSRAGRTEEAIATHERAMAAGYDAVPDPRMDVARYLAHAGRKEEARKIHEEVVAHDPGDVWFYNAAGFDEVDMGDHERAVRWFGAGIELCLGRNDPEGVLEQLAEHRAKSLEALDRPDDALQRRAEAALAAEGYDGALGLDVWGHHGPAGATTMAVAWFPREELAKALERWPHLAERFGTSDYGAYVRRLHERLLDVQRSSGRRPTLVAITVDGLVDFAADRGLEPERPSTLRAVAAELERQGQAREWPPGRNEPCWCGSGKKHKRCCGTGPGRPQGREQQATEPEGIPVYYELEVTLLGTDPPVRRRFQLPVTATFFDLHQAIQAACGWAGDHLFGFHDAERRAFAPDSSSTRPDDLRPPAARLSLGEYFSAWSTCAYLSDFGDNWVHEIVLQGRFRPAERFRRRLTGGQRAFPPEDCGGINGYHDCVDAVRGGEASAEIREWLGDWDPEAFDLEEARARFDR
jgi:tetratricopeptide (TPR) repeat protein